jgi:N-acetylglucosamine kinase-like BadF-type ATPase
MSIDPTELWLLGIDGGGSKTLAWLARLENAADDCTIDEDHVIGKGLSGPSNPQVVGFQSAINAVEEAVALAWESTGAPPRPVAVMAAALAGCGRAEDQSRFRFLSTRARLAEETIVVGDAEAALAAGAPDRVGVAVIAGTGSMVWGRQEDGTTVRSGGWGYLFGDEGSGYWLAIEALRSVARSADGRAQSTTLTIALLTALGLREPHELVGAIYGANRPREEIASLAQIVLSEASNGDRQAFALMERGASELALAVRAVVQQLDLPTRFGRESNYPDYRLICAGGLLANFEGYRHRLEVHLRQLAIGPAEIVVAKNPALGALRLALEHWRNLPSSPAA